MPLAYTMNGGGSSRMFGKLRLVSRAFRVYNAGMSDTNGPEIDREELTAAIVELNSMSPCDGVIMTREGKVKCGYTEDTDFLCMLIPAGVLARKLTADGLSSYGGKELKAWADKYEIEPLQEMVRHAQGAQ